MGTHGCECYHLASISGSNFHLVCISGRMREEADLGSSTAVMKVHRPKDFIFGKSNGHGWIDSSNMAGKDVQIQAAIPKQDI